MKKVFVLTCGVAALVVTAVVIDKLDLCHDEAADYRPFEPED
ncbi:hypothetical protein [Lacticaseibacillus pantheris]|jgi:hypothetical protein|nr:hypothetical protein [Lacticaseibacillus pantheris]